MAATSGSSDPASDIFAAFTDGDPRTDEDLVRDFLDGDTAAFGKIVTRHRARLTHVARRYAANEDDAQDIMQEAWLKASTSMSTYRSEAKLTTWLHRVVANKGYDFVTNKARRELPLLDDDDTTHRYSAQLVHDPYDHVDRKLLLTQIISALPEHQRTALILVDMLGHDLESAADELGVRTGTVKSRRARARTSLRDSIGADA